MLNAPNKIFILEEGKYIEISYEYYQRVIEENPNKRFLLLGGMLMEVSEEDYIQMNREKSKMQYQKKVAKQLGEFSYDAITTNEFDGVLILKDQSRDVCDVVEQRILVDKLREAIKMLMDDELELIKALFLDDVSEREYSREKGISHTAIQKKRHKILEKLRKLIENID